MEQYWKMEKVRNNVKSNYFEILDLTTNPIFKHAVKAASIYSFEGGSQTYINSRLQLMQRDPATVTQHLSSDVLTDGCRSWAQQLKTSCLKQKKDHVWSVCQRSSSTIEV